MRKKEKTSSWKRFSDEKPKEITIALVCNEKGFMCQGTIRAIYYPDYDVWLLYEPLRGESITLEVSHYFPVPTTPRLIK